MTSGSVGERQELLLHLLLLDRPVLTTVFRFRFSVRARTLNICDRSFERRVGRVAQSVQRKATGWTVRDRIPVGTRFSALVQTCPGAHPTSCTMDTGSFPGIQRGRGVTGGSTEPPVQWTLEAHSTRLK